MQRSLLAQATERGQTASRLAPSNASGRAPSATRTMTGTRSARATTCGEGKRCARDAASRCPVALALAGVRAPPPTTLTPWQLQSGARRALRSAGRPTTRRHRRNRTLAHRRDARRKLRKKESRRAPRGARARIPSSWPRRAGRGDSRAARAHRGRAPRRRPHAAVADAGAAELGRRARIDDDRFATFIAPVTEDEKLLQQPGRRGADFTRTDPWRVMRIMGEFIEGFDDARRRREGRHGLRLGAHGPRRPAVPGGAGDRAPARRGRLRDHHRRRPRHHGGGEQGRASSAAAARSAATSSCRSSRAPIRTSIRS